MNFKWRHISYFILLLFFAFIFKSCQTINSYCSYEEKVEKIRELPRDRLAQLYEDMKILYESDIEYFTIYSAQNEAGLPPQFSDIDVSFIKPKQALIVIGGCFDDKAFLNFRGYDILKETYSDPEIFMHWGEFCKECNVVIWNL